MTLLVAEAKGPEAWLIADTAIIDPRASLRRRINRPKITPLSGHAVIGFAGDPDLADRVIVAVANRPAGVLVVEELLAGHRTYPSVDFAYAFVDGPRARLFRIADSIAAEVPTLHLGMDAAFQQFQRLRHDTSIDHAPDALHTIMLALKHAFNEVASVQAAVLAMWRWFASTPDRDVGGWVTPYLLSVSGGVELCSYCYSVSDPIVNDLVPGQVIPHGTAPGGGFAFSLTSIDANGGMIAYWLQRPGGFVILPAGGAYEIRAFDGDPSRFKAAVRDTLGLKIDLWFGGEPEGKFTVMEVVNDQVGRPRYAVIRHENGTLSLIWLQKTPDSFVAETSIELPRT